MRYPMSDVILLRATDVSRDGREPVRTFRPIDSDRSEHVREEAPCAEIRNRRRVHSMGLDTYVKKIYIFFNSKSNVYGK